MKTWTHAPAARLLGRRGRIPAAGRWAAACLALVLGLGAAPAGAQWYEDEPYYDDRWERRLPPPPRPLASYPLNEVDDLDPRGVVQMLRGRGYREVALPRRRGTVYLVEATDAGERRVRLAVNAFTGRVMSREVLGPAMASPAPRERAPSAESPRERAARQAPPRQASRAEPSRPATPSPAPAPPPAPLPPARPAEAAPADVPQPVPTTAATAPEPRAPDPAPAPSAPGWVTPPSLPGGEAGPSESPASPEAPPRIRVIEGVTPVSPRGDGPSTPAGSAEARP